MTTDGNLSFGTLLLSEYQQIKTEQQARIGFRDNLLYATLASMAAVIAATLQQDGEAALLLMLPPASVLLGWTYVVNDEKISAIGRYVRQDLAPRLLAQVGEADRGASDVRVFGWEQAHRSDRRRVSRKRLQLAVDLSVFCVAPLAALLAYWTGDGQGVALVAVSVVELAAVALLAAQILAYADLGRDSGT